MFDHQEEPQTWLTVPKWLWQLGMVCGTVLTMWLALLLIPAATVVAVTALTVADGDPVPQLPDIEGISWPVSSDACPSSLTAMPDYQAGESRHLECTCDASAVMAEASVWGTEMYTSDSSICRAARHAGVVGVDGGRVAVQTAAGCGVYRSSERHGVATSAWESWSGSFFFPSRSQGACDR